MRPDIVDGVVVFRWRERSRFPRPDHFTAKTETAIDRANVNQLEQHPVGIAMHDAADWRMRVIADWIGILAWDAHQLLNGWDELSRDRIIRIARVDQRSNVRRHRDRIARSDLFQLRKRSERR